MCAKESNRKHFIGNPLFLLRACVGESSTSDVAYVPLRWKQECFSSKWDKPAIVTSEGFGVPVNELNTALTSVLEAFTSKPPTDIGKIVKSLTSQTCSVHFKVAASSRREEPPMLRSLVCINEDRASRIRLIAALTWHPLSRLTLYICKESCQYARASSRITPSNGCAFHHL